MAKKKNNPDALSFPVKIAAPALRALKSAGITSFQQLSRVTENELSELHGMGPNALSKIKAAMNESGQQFRRS